MAFKNPIIPGFAPDPSIVLVQDTFYLVNSSFHLYPGLPIFASKDLIAWRHIGNAIHRPTQLSLAQSSTKLNRDSASGESAPATGGLYAPTIRHHNGVTYIVCTNVIYDLAKDKEGDWVSGLTFQNFIISTPDICSGQWSDPVFFDFHGIDPDLFFDDDGRAYISGSSWHPVPSSCIVCFEVDIATGRKVTEEKVLWTGHMGCIPEGPHIYKRNGWYYLLISEGGTHDGHCISIARARTIWGHYETCERNPILPPMIGIDQSVFCHNNGHGDLVRDPSGDWWLVCLGARKDRAGRMVLGRETFLTAVKWQDGQVWPEIQWQIPRVLCRRPLGDEGECDESGCSVLVSLPVEGAPSPLSPRLDLVWVRDPDLSRCRGSQDGRMISLLPSRTDLGQCTGEPTAFVGRRQRRLAGSATVDLMISSFFEQTVDAKIGLAYYKDEHRYARIMYQPSSGAVIFEAVNRAKDPPIVMEKSVGIGCAPGTKIQFRILYTEQLLHFLYRVGEVDGRSGWHSCGLIDTLELTGNDFTGPVIGIFAIGVGEEWWTFENVDI